MSKESKPRDRWSQVFTAAADRPDTWCRGCGYHHVAYGAHRADCTTRMNTLTTLTQNAQRDAKCCCEVEPVLGQHLGVL